MRADFLDFLIIQWLSEKMRNANIPESIDAMIKNAFLHRMEIGSVLFAAQQLVPPYTV